MHGVNAEAMYAFRHSLLRDAAYQLQPPGERARRHRLVFEVIEALCGGRPPDPPPLSEVRNGKAAPHPADEFAEGLAAHARLSGSAPDGAFDPRAARIRYDRRAAEHAARQDRFDPACEAWLRYAEDSSGAEPGEAGLQAAFASRMGGRSRRAEEHDRRAVASLRAHGCREAIGSALSGLGVCLMSIGSVPEAEKRLEEALAVWRSIGDTSRERLDLGNLTLVYLQSGRMAEAETGFHRCLERDREAGDVNRTAQSLANMRLAAGDLKGAEAGYLRALEIFRDTGDRRSEGRALGNLHQVLAQTGRIEEAERSGREALAIHREVHNRVSEGILLGNFADLYSRSGRAELAETTFGEALAVVRQTGDRRVEGSTLCSLACHLISTGRAGEARQAWVEGTTCLESAGDVESRDAARSSMREACARAGVATLDEGAR
jgi:tetratricopeptide (TPR) repeat protein